MDFDKLKKDAQEKFQQFIRRAKSLDTIKVNEKMKDFAYNASKKFRDASFNFKQKIN